MPSVDQVGDALLRIAGRMTDVIADEVEDAAFDTRRIEQSVTHVKTGRLRDSETVFGPFEQGNAIEARIVPVDVPYAEIEASRGADHNFAERAVNLANPQLRMRVNLERSIARMLNTL